MGSQRHMIEQMFSETSRGLYKLAEPYPLARIASECYKPWIRKLYRKYKKVSIDDDIIDTILQRCENHPLYVQQFFYFLWKETDITPSVITACEEKIINRRYHEYANIWDKLTSNQKKALVVICITGGENIYKTDNLQRISMKGPSQMKKAIEYLVIHDHIYKNGRYQFSDVMFKKWIKRHIKK